MKKRDFTLATQFSFKTVLCARRYWKGLTLNELLFFWRHYTDRLPSVGQTCYLHYSGVTEQTSFFDYLVMSAEQSAYERAMDI